MPLTTRTPGDKGGGRALIASWEGRNDAGVGQDFQGDWERSMAETWSPAGVWGSGALIPSCPQRRFLTLFDNEFGARTIFEKT